MNCGKKVDWDELAASSLDELDYAAYRLWRDGARLRYYTIAKKAQDELNHKIRPYLNDYRSAIYKADIIYKTAILKKQEEDPTLTLRGAYQAGQPDYDELMRKEDLAKKAYTEDTKPLTDEFNARLQKAQEEYDAECEAQVSYLLSNKELNVV